MARTWAAWPLRTPLSRVPAPDGRSSRCPVPERAGCGQENVSAGQRRSANSAHAEVKTARARSERPRERASGSRRHARSTSVVCSGSRRRGKASRQGRLVSNTQGGNGHMPIATVLGLSEPVQARPCAPPVPTSSVYKEQIINIDAVHVWQQRRQLHGLVPVVTAVVPEHTTEGDNGCMPEDEAWHIVSQWRIVFEAAREDKRGDLSNQDYAEALRCLCSRTFTPEEASRIEATSGVDPLTLAPKVPAAESALREHYANTVYAIRKKYKLPAGARADAAAFLQLHLRDLLWTFDTSRGLRFTTYLYSSLMGHMQMFLSNHDSFILRPHGFVSNKLKVRTALADLFPDVEEGAVQEEHVRKIAQHLNMSRATVKNSLSHSTYFVPMEELSEDWSELIECPGDASAVDCDVDALLDVLDDDAAKLLSDKFGLRGKAPVKMVELARQYGFKSRGSVAYAVNRALQKLRKHHGSEELERLMRRVELTMAS